MSRVRCCECPVRIWEWRKSTPGRDIILRKLVLSIGIVYASESSIALLQPIADGAAKNLSHPNRSGTSCPRSRCNKIVNPLSMFVSKGLRRQCYLNHIESQPITEAFQPKPSSLLSLPQSPPPGTVPFRPLRSRDHGFPITITFFQAVCDRSSILPPHTMYSLLS